MANQRPIPFFWAVGVAAWYVMSRILLNVLPPQPGPHSERPLALALVGGGFMCMAFTGIDIVREPRRLWLWGLAGGAAIFCLNVGFGIVVRDSDLDQWIGWGSMLGAVATMGTLFLNVLIWAVEKLRPEAEPD